MKHKYSQEFRTLISSEDSLRDLLTNCSFSGTFQAWERRKAFIGSAIHKSGTFLDIGSGNGFLLRCLQEWADYDITPYGIDISEEYIRKAKELFPGQADHFAAGNIRQISRIGEYLPDAYDFVYFSADWSQNEVSETDARFIKSLEQLIASGGRLIIGFYGEDVAVNQQNVNALLSSGARLDQTLYNPEGTNLVTLTEVE
jgi:SAM-dependent methyltransferase